MNRLFILVSLCLIGASSAATHTVTTSRDENNGPSPALSLREAIGLAFNGDTICFDSTLSGAEIRLDSHIDIDHSLIIDASDLDCPVAISGIPGDHIFTTSTNAESVTLSHLILQRGTSSTERGGAINVREENSLILENCIIRHHRGSAVRTEDDATLVVRDCEFYGNNALLGAGAGGGSDDNGAAIFTDSGSDTTIEASSFYHNTAQSGGAIFASGQTTITNSTIAENVTDGIRLGAIYNDVFSSMDISHCTIVGNIGTALSVSVTGSSIDVSYTVLAQNFRNDGDASNGSRYDSLGYNLTDIADPELDAATDVINTDPLLSKLGYHGGAGLTYLPLVGSPLIDGGSDTPFPGTPSTDSRGLARQINGDASGNAELDIGAIEVGAPATVTNTNSSGAGSFLDTILQPGTTRVVFDPSLSGQAITPSTTALFNAGHIDIDASNLPGGVILTGRGTRLLLLTGDATASMQRIAVAGVENSTNNDMFNLTGKAGLGINGCLFFQNQIPVDLFKAAECSRLHVAGSEFFDHTGTSGTAASLIRASDWAFVQIQKSSFIDNEIDQQKSGGSLVISDDESTLEVRNTTFARNLCPEDGAPLIFSSIVRSAVTFSTFVKNSAEGDAGAVQANSETRVEDCLFSCNRSEASTGSDIFVPTSSQNPEEIIGNITDQAIAGSILDNDDNFSTTELLLAPLANHAGIIRTVQPFQTSTFLTPQFSNDERLRAFDAHGRITNDSRPGAVGVSRAFVRVRGTADSGEDSLREAIEAIDPGGVITFNESDMFIALQSPIIIDKDITIDATDRLRTTISGSRSNRIFDILPGANVAIYGVTMRDGNASGQNGGAIRCGGNLSLANCAVINSTANFGGGLWAGQGAFSSVVIDNCTFTGNSSTISGNAIGSTQARIRLTHSTIHNNDGNNGGGFNLLGTAHTAGLYLAGANSSLEFGHIILTDNKTRPANGGGLRNGGIILNAQINSLGFSLSDSQLAPFNVPSDIALADPMLGSQETLGHSITLPPLPGSPAIDAGDPDLLACPNRDQRGGNRIADNRIDIGAHETNPNAEFPELTIDRLLGNGVRLSIEGEPGVFWQLEHSSILSEFQFSELILTPAPSFTKFVPFPPGQDERLFYRLKRLE